jgi:hypothetical protein
MPPVFSLQGKIKFISGSKEKLDLYVEYSQRSILKEYSRNGFDEKKSWFCTAKSIEYFECSTSPP